MDLEIDQGALEYTILPFKTILTLIRQGKVLKMQLRRIQYEYSILFFPTEHSLFGKMLQKMKFIVCFLSFCQSNMIVALSKKKFATSIQICHPRCSSCHSYQTRLIEIYFAIKNLSSNSIHVMPLQMVPKMQCPVGLYTFILFYP